MFSRLFFRSSFAFVGVVLVGLLAAIRASGGILGTAVASADGAQVQDIPLNFGLINPCNGEFVAVTGVEHVVSNTTTTPAGGVELSQQVTWRLMGTGSLGNSYRSINNIGAQNHGQTRKGVTFTFPQTFTLISEGSAPNFTVNVLFHITFNPDGTVTAFVNTFSASCRG
jgi:hypothetical protein